MFFVARTSTRTTTRESETEERREKREAGEETGVRREKRRAVLSNGDVLVIVLSATGAVAALAMLIKSHAPSDKQKSNQ